MYKEKSKYDQEIGIFLLIKQVTLITPPSMHSKANKHINMSKIVFLDDTVKNITRSLLKQTKQKDKM
jgi:hypothetical protein